MNRLPIALQLYSVRDEVEADFDGALAAVKAMGYDGVEFAGLCGHTAAEVKAMCEKHGLAPIAVHVSYGELAADADGVLATYAQIGCRYVAIPAIDRAMLPGQPDFPAFAADVRRIGAAAKQHGIQLLYHNHDFEFEPVDGQLALDVFFREIPADLLATELDTCWVNVGGQDPAAYLRKYAGRAPAIHLQDFTGRRNDKTFALRGKQTDDAFDYRPVGQGLQDVPAILAAARDAGVEWIIVEQDDPCLGRTAMECAKCSIGYLKNLSF